MYEIEFGKLIDKLIYFSGQKNYSLAMKLGYDVSYISKWINLNTLPSNKNIKNISSITANFIVDSCNQSSLDDIIDYFKIDFNENDDKNKVIKQVIEDKINKAYSYSYDISNNKILRRYEDQNNSIQIINTSSRKKYLSQKMNVDTSFYYDIIILCNLFSLNKEDKVNITSIKNYENKECFKARYLINFDANIKDIVYDVMLFLEMITSKNRINIEMYSCDFAPSTLITVVKDKFVHTSIYNNNKCLTTITSHDKDVVEEMYATLEDMINYQCKPTFNKITSKDMILKENYMNYIMDENLKLVLGEINELFMPSDLFLEIGESIYGSYKEIISKLKKIDTILRNATYNSNLHVIMFESALRKYASSGNIKFFNNPIKLNLEQRQRQLSYIKEITKNDNINFRVIENNLLDNIKIDENPSMYLSDKISFLKQEYNENSADYMIINDKNLIKILNNFFEKVWIEKVISNNNSEHDSENIITESLRYINILNDNIKNTN